MNGVNPHTGEPVTPIAFNSRYLAPHFASEFHEVKYQHPFNGQMITHWAETKKRPMLLGDLDDESVWWDQLEWAPGPREMAYGDL